MEILQIEDKLQELLLPVFGFDSIDDIQLDESLVDDLGAESLDFVEILWLIDDSFGVILETDDIVGGSSNLDQPIFVNDRLTTFGAAHIQARYQERASKINAGMNKVSIFRLVTVRDIAHLIQDKLAQVSEPC